MANDSTTCAGDADERAAEERVVSCLESNHGNTLPMLAILNASLETRPYREMENEVYDLPVMHMSRQNAHVLANALFKCGALERIAIEDDAAKEAHASAADDVAAGEAVMGDETGGAESGKESENEGEAEFGIENEAGNESDDKAGNEIQGEDEEQPVDYLVRITPAGRKALDAFHPLNQFNRLISSEPKSYDDAYRQVLLTCLPGASRAVVERALEDHPALVSPKRIYPGYFISKLETVDGIAWENDCWNTTEFGREMIACLS